jgi:hypothetical protein
MSPPDNADERFELLLDLFVDGWPTERAPEPGPSLAGQQREQRLVDAPAVGLRH